MNIEKLKNLVNALEKIDSQIITAQNILKDTPQKKTLKEIHDMLYAKVKVNGNEQDYAIPIDVIEKLEAKIMKAAINSVEAVLKDRIQELTDQKTKIESKITLKEDGDEKKKDNV